MRMDYSFNCVTVNFIGFNSYKCTIIIIIPILIMKALKWKSSAQFAYDYLSMELFAVINFSEFRN